MTQPEAYDEEPDEQELGPDERDQDLLDGTWEEDYYAGRVRTRDWRGISVAVSLLVIVALVLGAIAVWP